MSFSIDEFIKNKDLKLTKYEIAYLKEVNNFPKLGVKEEKALVYEAKVNKNEKARKKLIECSLRYVLPIARNYLNRGLSLFDLIEEGNKGLVIAYEKYKVEKESYFRGCVYYYVNQNIRNALSASSRLIRLSQNKYEENFNFIKALHELERETKRNLTIEEIAKELNYSKKFVYETLLTIKTIVSLEELQEKETLFATDSFFEDEELIYEENFDNFYDKEFILFLKTFLNNKQLETIALKAGLIDGKEWSLEEIGKKHGISRQAVKNKCVYISKNSKILKLCKGGI